MGACAFPRSTPRFLAGSRFWGFWGFGGFEFGIGLGWPVQSGIGLFRSFSLGLGSFARSVWDGARLGFRPPLRGLGFALREALRAPPAPAKEEGPFAGLPLSTLSPRVGGAALPDTPATDRGDLGSRGRAGLASLAGRPALAARPGTSLQGEAAAGFGFAAASFGLLFGVMARSASPLLVMSSGCSLGFAFAGWMFARLRLCS